MTTLDMTPEQREVFEYGQERFARLTAEIEAAIKDPRYFLRHCSATDSRTGEEFRFDFGPDSGWAWQGDVLQDFMDHQITLALKARQLGISWIAIGGLAAAAGTSTAASATASRIRCTGYLRDVGRGPGDFLKRHQCVAATGLLRSPWLTSVWVSP